MNILILTEGGDGIGYGHITRCSALYDYFSKNGNECLMVIANYGNVSGSLIGLNVIERPWYVTTPELIQLFKKNDLIIVDSYIAELPFYEMVASFDKKLLVIDDYCRLDFKDCTIVNGAIGAENLPYSNKKHHLLGSRYIPLRSPFWEKSERTISETVHSVLITFGGDDMRNLTPAVVKMIRDSFPSLLVKIVIGNGFKNQDELRRLTDDAISIHSNINAREMKTLLLEADIVISACGQTLYECAQTGSPVIGVGIAENQKVNISGFLEAGYLEFAGWYYDERIMQNIYNNIIKIYDYGVRRKLSEIGQTLVDGQGVSRIFDKTMELINQ